MIFFDGVVTFSPRVSFSPVVTFGVIDNSDGVVTFVGVVISLVVVVKKPEFLSPVQSPEFPEVSKGRSRARAGRVGSGGRGYIGL